MTFSNLGYERRLQALERFMREIRGDRGATAPVTWTPQLYQNGDITSTNTVSRYVLIGNLAFVQFRIAATAAGSAGNQIEIQDLPVAPLYASDTIVVGAGTVFDNGTALYSAAIQTTSTPAFRFVPYGVNGLIGANPSFAIASGDIVYGTAVYEI